MAIRIHSLSPNCETPKEFTKRFDNLEKHLKEKIKKMKVLYWNISKKNQPLSGVKRYEDELFSNIRKIDPSLDINRIQRVDNKVLGNTFLSWFYRYTLQDADIIHATFQTLTPIIHIRRPKKFIVTVHDLGPLVYPVLQNDISTKIQWSLTPEALQKADKIIAISEFTKKEIIRLCGIDKSKIKVVYQGVDHTKYYPMDRLECKKKFGLPPKDKHILVVASNLLHKRMDLIKKIINMVHKTRPDVKLIKVGYGDVLQGEGIISPGWVSEEDMPALYNAADVFLHTAEYEGFGLPVLEAMACGVPVVVSKSASLPEIVEHSGELVDLSDPEFLYNFSGAILRTLNEGDAKEGLERSKRFTWEKTASETYQLYKEAES
ncbi:MAG: glycosyltransferase family 4 protein [Methanoregulaceae archaeon]|nr:glycosyltransferase family 4 protein [Methanoregulaceae archaeon]